MQMKARLTSQWLGFRLLEVSEKIVNEKYTYFDSQLLKQLLNENMSMTQICNGVLLFCNCNPLRFSLNIPHLHQ